MTFFGTFLKNVARIECATYYERLYNAYIQFAKNFPKMPKFSWVISRSSRPKVFFKRDVLENFAKSTRNPKYRSLFLIKLQSSIPQLCSKKKLQHGNCPMNFAEFPRTSPGGCLFFRYFKRGFSIL